MTIPVNASATAAITAHIAQHVPQLRRITPDTVAAAYVANKSTTIDQLKQRVVATFQARPSPNANARPERNLLMPCTPHLCWSGVC